MRKWIYRIRFYVRSSVKAGLGLWVKWSKLGMRMTAFLLFTCSWGEWGCEWIEWGFEYVWVNCVMWGYEWGCELSVKLWVRRMRLWVNVVRRWINWVSRWVNEVSLWGFHWAEWVKLWVWVEEGCEERSETVSELRMWGNEMENWTGKRKRWENSWKIRQELSENIFSRLFIIS